MNRILAIDYGSKRTGLAWTDPLGLFATRLEPVDTPRLHERLAELIPAGPVATILLGYPTRPDGRPTDATAGVEKLEQELRQQFPAIKLLRWDERYTSVAARQAMVEAGVPKSKRAGKHLINSVSATILLQDYLESESL